jgi:hypothetical protein
MLTKLGKNKILWFLTALLSLAAALIGVVNPDIYSKVVSAEFLPGVMSQDLTTIIASVIILFCVVRTKERDFIKQIIVLGIISYLFYAYGIYVIEQFYNALYFLYMAIFGLSFYSIIYGVVNIRQDILKKVQLPKLMRNVSMGFLLFVPSLFIPLWLSKLVPLIQNGQKIEFTYSIYILDLCFIMPLFIIIAIMAAKKKGLGLLLTPALFIKGFTVLFPVGLAEILKTLYNQTANTGGIWLYWVLSILFLMLVILYLRNLKISGIGFNG